jgi:hypothetical protein
MLNLCDDVEIVACALRADCDESGMLDSSLRIGPAAPARTTLALRSG